MASSIFLLALAATVCMSQTVDPTCSENSAYCLTDGECCSNQCLANSCCQNAGACNYDLDCCVHYTGSGGCNANGTCGTCVPINGTCTTTADCCVGPTPLGLTCANNICTPVLYNAYFNTIITYYFSYGILDPNHATTLRNIFFAFIDTFAPRVEFFFGNITVDEVAALGNITRNQFIDVLNASAPFGLLPDAPRSIDNITVGHLNNFFEDLFAVANSQPHVTFSDVPGLDPNLITGLAGTSISDVADIGKSFIAAISGNSSGSITGISRRSITPIVDTSSLTMTEVASTIGGDIVLDDLASLAGIGYLRNFRDLTLDKFATAADLYADLFISTSNNNVCNTNSDCCSGPNCDCCRPVGSGVKFCGTCPCINNGACHRGSDCCNGRCCNGGGHGNNCNGNLCLAGRGNCACAVNKG